MRRAALLMVFAALPLLGDDTPIATILCYHEVDASPDHATIPRRTANGSEESEQLRYTTTPSDFHAQLDYLAANGYNVIPLATLVDYLEGRSGSIPSKAVVITVDDGWACAYSEVYPELQKRALPWTLFVYPKIVGCG